MEIKATRTGTMLVIEKSEGTNYTAERKSFVFSTFEGLDISISMETIIFAMSVISEAHKEKDVSKLISKIKAINDIK